MTNTFESTMIKVNDLNPRTKFWGEILTCAILKYKMSKYIWLVEVASVQVLGLVENKCIFNTFSFFKNKFSSNLDIYFNMHTKFLQHHGEFPLQQSHHWMRIHWKIQFCCGAHMAYEYYVWQMITFKLVWWHIYILSFFFPYMCYNTTFAYMFSWL